MDFLFSGWFAMLVVGFVGFLSCYLLGPKEKIKPRGED